jgi:DNA-binding transcriptional ArsR family regulator
MAKRKVRRDAPASVPEGTYTLTDLEQIRALADPLRLRMLGAFCGVPRTTKQVADLLGEKPTKLYHHVEALERVGLIRLQETRPNRGTVEKYFQAVAAKFQASASALSPSPEAKDKLSAQQKMVNSILDSARAELLVNVRPGSAADACPKEEAPVVGRMMISGSRQEVQGVRRRLLQWIDKLRTAEGRTEPSGQQGAADQVTYMFTFVLCKQAPEPRKNKPGATAK